MSVLSNTSNTADRSEHVPMATKLGYGFGAIAYGIKDNGFSVFLLLFYNQVLGLPAAQVSLVIALALIVDAFVDPVVGHLSDRTDTRWGRRHPWLYLSAIPIALIWLMLWNPPAVGDGVLLVYLFVTAVLVRAIVSCYEVPSLALAPEITRDYHERTIVLRYRFLFGWAGGLFMLILAFAVLLVPAPGYPNGQLNPAGYERFALVGSALMLVAVLMSAIATHKRLAHRPPAAAPGTSIDHSLKAILATLRVRPFLILMMASVFAFANQGLTFALSNYLLLFVWEFEQFDFIVYAFVLFVGVVIAFVVVPQVARRTEKRTAAAGFAIIAVILGTAPYWLRALGLFPGNDDPLLMPVFLTLVGLATGAGVGTMMLTTSMMADITDWSEERTGQRREGLFFAGFFFTQKCVTGVGILLSGLIITGVGFPAGATPGAVDAAVVTRLGLTFASVTVVLGLVAAACYVRFPIGHSDHASRVARLAAATGAGD